MSTSTGSSTGTSTASGSGTATSSSGGGGGASSSSASTSGPSTSNPNTLSDSQQQLKEFWPTMAKEIKNMNASDLRVQELPLARIKKIMKLDEDVKMISAEAPVLFAKAAEIFIHELTLRAWIHTEDNKRRTLQRNDIAMAITKYDQFDFLIDIVPRDEIKPSKKEEKHTIGPEQVQYYLQLAQQHNAALQLQQATTGGIQVVQTGGLGSGLQTYQLVQGPNGAQVIQQQLGATIGHHQPTILLGGGQQVAFQQQSQPTATAAAAGSGALQIVQQVLGPNGEIQQVPVQLTASQLQMLRMQLQGSAAAGGLGTTTGTQPIILQTQGSTVMGTAGTSTPGTTTQIIQS